MGLLVGTSNYLGRNLISLFPSPQINFFFFFSTRDRDVFLRNLQVSSLALICGAHNFVKLFVIVVVCVGCHALLWANYHNYRNIFAHFMGDVLDLIQIFLPSAQCSGFKFYYSYYRSDIELYRLYRVTD